MLVLPPEAASTGSDNLLSDETVYITQAFEIVDGARTKPCSKSTMALFLSNAH